MAGHDATTRTRVERSGLGLVEAAVGLTALEGLLLQAAAALPAQAAVVPIRWTRFLQQHSKPVPPMFAAFMDQAEAASASALPATVHLTARNKRLWPRRNASRLLALLRMQLCQQQLRRKPLFQQRGTAPFMLLQVQEAVAAVLAPSMWTHTSHSWRLDWTACRRLSCTTA